MPGLLPVRVGQEPGTTSWDQIIVWMAFSVGFSPGHRISQPQQQCGPLTMAVHTAIQLALGSSGLEDGACGCG